MPRGRKGVIFDAFSSAGHESSVKTGAAGQEQWGRGLRGGLAGDSGVGGEAGEEDMDYQDVEGQRGEAEQLDVVGAAATPAGGGAGVQEGRVDDPGDERPG